MNQSTNTETAHSRLRWLYNISGAAALIVGTLLLIAVISLIITVLQPNPTVGWLSALENNWLVVIFKLHAGFSGVQSGLLHVLNLLDIAILALVGVMYLGLYAALRRTSRIWSIIAAIQPFLGIVLFLATRTAGRSGVMGAGLVISIVMLRSDIFKKFTAYVGILASVLLLVGDFSVGAIPPLGITAMLFGIGYMLFITWYFLNAQRLFQLGSSVLKEQAQ